MKKLSVQVLGLLALMSIGGCELLNGPMQLDPPEMVLELGRPYQPHISKVEVTNGANVTVMSGRPSLRGNLTANPDRNNLDGTLTIKSTWSDGDVTTQTVRHTPNSRILLTYNSDRRGFVVEEIPDSSPTDSSTETRGD